VSSPSRTILPLRLRDLVADAGGGNPYLQIMRFAAVAGVVAALLLLVSGMTTGSTPLLVLAVVAFLWTAMVQVGWWVVAALVWERTQD
jgi:hypothetical protein